MEIGGRVTGRGPAQRRHSDFDSDFDLFLPVGAAGPALDHAEAAKAVCRGCPVRADCLDFALVSNQGAGVWGGTIEEERRKLRRMWREQLGGRRRSGPAAWKASAQQAVELAADDGVALTRGPLQALPVDDGSSAPGDSG